MVAGRARGLAGFRNVHEGARDFANENFHCGSFLVVDHHQRHAKIAVQHTIDSGCAGLNCQRPLLESSFVDFKESIWRPKIQRLCNC